MKFVAFSFLLLSAISVIFPVGESTGLPGQSRYSVNLPKQSSNLDDVLQRKIAVLESVSGGPLIRGTGLLSLESKEIKLDEWEKRSLFHRIREWFAHLFAQWL